MSAIQWLCRRAAAMSLLSSPRRGLLYLGILRRDRVASPFSTHEKSCFHCPHFYFCAIASLWMSGVRTPNRGKMATFRLRSRVQYRINLCAYT